MTTFSFSRLIVASSAAFLLTACASNSSSYETDSSTLPDSSTNKKTGWQVENSPLSMNQQEFVQQVSKRYNIPKNFVQNMLSQANINTRVITLMSPKNTTAVKRHWQTYRGRFVEPIRTRKGTAFWNNYRSDLAVAEQKYGVPAAVITGIIGVETIYGEQMGTFSVLDSLYTLGFNHPDPSRPEKSQMFRNQLAALIELTHKGKFDGYTATGSFAGAFGLGQFMPISILHYAVDADGDGRIDLRNSKKDAIHSVANFLVKHGWQSNMPIFAPVTLPPSPANLVDGGLDAKISWAQLQAQGARSNASGAKWQDGIRIGVIDLKDDVRGNHEYRTATQNFFAITKYNRSYFYAASVADLASVLAKEQIRLGHQVTRP